MRPPDIHGISLPFIQVPRVIKIIIAYIYGWNLRENIVMRLHAVQNTMALDLAFKYRNP